MARQPGLSLTTEEAAALLGWGEDTFERVAAAEAEWFHPMGVRGPSNQKLWPRRLVRALAVMYERKALPPRESGRKKSGENPEPP